MNIKRAFWIIVAILFCSETIYGFFMTLGDIFSGKWGDIVPDFIALAFFGFVGWFSITRVLKAESIKQSEDQIKEPEHQKETIEEKLDQIQNYYKMPELNEYPEIKSILEDIVEYIKALNNKNYRVSSYIYESLYNSLGLFKDVVTTPIKNTEQGKRYINDVKETLNLLLSTLSTMYSRILEGQAVETEALISALKLKLGMEGVMRIDNFKKTKTDI